MTGEVLINNTDIWTVYHAFISENGYAGLVEWPSIKDIDYNNWQEVDGIDADLTEIHLAPHTANIRFGVKGNATQIAAFYEFLCGHPTFTGNFAALGTTRVLRIIRMTSLDYAFSFGVIDLLVSDDASPLANYSYQAPSATRMTPNSDFAIDGIYLSAYGIHVLNGSYNTLLMRRGVKELLKRDINTLHGATYDDNALVWNSTRGQWEKSTAAGSVTYDSVEVQLDCGLVATSKTQFWRNYMALLYNLIKPNESASIITDRCRRTLTLAESQESLYCFYKGQSMSDFSLGGDKIIAQFTISLEVINSA